MSSIRHSTLDKGALKINSFKAIHKGNGIVSVSFGYKTTLLQSNYGKFSDNANFVGSILPYFKFEVSDGVPYTWKPVHKAVPIPLRGQRPDRWSNFKCNLDLGYILQSSRNGEKRTYSFKIIIDHYVVANDGGLSVFDQSGGLRGEVHDVPEEPSKYFLNTSHSPQLEEPGLQTNSNGWDGVLHASPAIFGTSDIGDSSLTGIRFRIKDYNGEFTFKPKVTIE